MEEKLKYWSKRYKLKDLVICGYQGGYPMIQFKKRRGYECSTYVKI